MLTTISRDAPKIKPPIYFHRSYNIYRKHNNSIGWSKFSATKQDFFFLIHHHWQRVFTSDQQEPAQLPHKEVALKIMPPSLLYCPAISEADVGGMAVEDDLPANNP